MDKKIELKRINITMLPETYEWLRLVAFSKHSNISKEIRDMIAYTKSISYWGALEVNKMKGEKNE